MGNKASRITQPKNRKTTGAADKPTITAFQPKTTAQSTNQPSRQPHSPINKKPTSTQPYTSATYSR
ncbi:MAG: hypothetical protein ACM3UY_07975 [Methanocella sp.]